MAPTFESVKNFDDVPLGESGVDMSTFLEATHGLIEILDFLGSAIFALLSHEMKTCHSALTTVYESDHEKSQTLEILIRNGAASPWNDGVSKLVYLLRCLQTVGTGMKDLREDPEAQTVVCFQRAYDKSLSSQHSWITRGVVSVAMPTAPLRSDIFEKLDRECPPGRLEPEMARYFDGLGRIIDHLSPMLKEGGYGDV